MQTKSITTEREHLVVVNQLGKRYGNFEALSDCSLEIQRGEVFGLLGPNGAGKTTLMRCLLGFLKPTSGWATIGGFDVWKQRQSAHQLISYMPAQPQLPRLLRGRDVLRFFADIRPDADFERACDLARRLDLDLRRWVALMSTGMRQKLAIAATLCSRAPLIFLDEPTANLDPDIRLQLLAELAEMKSQGRSIVFSSHVLSEIEQVCDRVVVLAKGKRVGMTVIGQMKQSNLIRGRCDHPEHSLFRDSPVQWDGNRFILRTDQPLERLLPLLQGAEVQELSIQPQGLADVYRQHLAFDAPESDAVPEESELSATEVRQ